MEEDASCPQITGWIPNWNAIKYQGNTGIRFVGNKAERISNLFLGMIIFEGDIYYCHVELDPIIFKRIWILIVIWEKAWIMTRRSWQLLIHAT